MVKHSRNTFLIFKTPFIPFVHCAALRITASPSMLNSQLTAIRLSPRRASRRAASCPPPSSVPLFIALCATSSHLLKINGGVRFYIQQLARLAVSRQSEFQFSIPENTSQKGGQANFGNNDGVLSKLNQSDK